MSLVPPDPILALESLAYAWPGEAGGCLEIDQFQVAAGEQVFLQGESGSGKSTLLNLVAGVLVPQQGRVTALGQVLSSLSAAARDRFRVDHMGLIFQQFNLIPYLSVLDNVLLPTRFSPRRRARAGEGGRDPRQAAAALLTHLDLDAALWGRQATRLSVGQQQRVAAARALIGRPEILIADEPTSALDAARQAAFLDLLRQECAAAGSALLFVSHDQRLAAGFDRQVHMDEINSLPPPQAGEHPEGHIGRGEGKVRKGAGAVDSTPSLSPSPSPRGGGGPI
jgi:putative ABC transport system ATP-binding protein